MTAKADTDETTRNAISFDTHHDLVAALLRAATAHGEHEQRTAGYDENWPAWYAAYMIAEQAGTNLPT